LLPLVDIECSLLFKSPQFAKNAKDLA
jgi:hypothetical protein